MDYYPTAKRNEVLTPATTWTSLENMMLGETSQTQKDNCCTIPFRLDEILTTGKFLEIKIRLEGSRAWQGREGGLTGYCLSVCGDENVLEIGSGDWLHDALGVVNTTKLYM